MPNRNLVLALAILAIVLVIVPLVGMLGMMAAGGACCPGMMRTGGNMTTISTIGSLWMLAAAAVIIALVTIVTRSVDRVVERVLATDATH